MTTLNNDLSKFFQALARYDHNDLNAIQALGERKVEIPVRLENKGKKAVEGSVNLIPVRVHMEAAAVYLFENVLNEHDMHVEWDRAIAGDNVVVDPCDYKNVHDFVPAITQYDRSKGLRENMAYLTSKYKILQQSNPAQSLQYQKGIDLAAAVVAHTATVKSVDLEEFVFHKKNEFGSHFMGFRPRGLKF